MTGLSEIQGDSQPCGATPRFLGDAVAAGLEQLALVGFAHLALAVGVGVAVADDLVAALHAGSDQLRAIVVKRGVDERGGRQRVVEEFEAAPHADAVAVVAPGIVQHVGFGTFRAERRAEALAESEVLDVESRDTPPAGAPPGQSIMRAPRDGRIGDSGRALVVRAALTWRRGLECWRGRRAPSAIRRCRSRLPFSRFCRGSRHSGRRSGCLRTACRRAIRRSSVPVWYTMVSSSVPPTTTCGGLELLFHPVIAAR